MGRHKKPTNLLILSGSYRNDRHGGRVEIEPAAVRIPSGMSEGAIKVWRGLASRLSKMGLLTNVDVPEFQKYCETTSLYRQALAIVVKDGATYLDSKGIEHVRPEVRLCKQYADLSNTIGQQFGLSPTARTKLRINDFKKDTTEEDFLFGKNVKLLDKAD